MLDGNSMLMYGAPSPGGSSNMNFSNMGDPYPGGGGQMHHQYASAGAAPGVTSTGASGVAAAGGPAPVKLSKIIACEIKGTMNAFSVMGPNAASWKPVEGKHASIFGMDDNFDVSSSTGAEMGGGGGGSSQAGGSMLLNADLAAATNALRNVTITKATLLQSYNTFGVPLGVTVSCLPKNEVVDTGDKYTFTTIPNTAVNTPANLYEAGNNHLQAMEWMRNYGKFNANNLNTQDVLKIPGVPYVFVHENHPVIHLLRINKNMVGVDVDSQEKMDNAWIKVTSSLFDSSCEAIKNRILARIKTHDLNDLTVSFFGAVCCLTTLFFRILLDVLFNFHRSSSTASAAWIGRTSTAQTRSCPSSQTPRGTPIRWRPTSRPTSRALLRSLARSWPGSTWSMRCSDDDDDI